MDINIVAVLLNDTSRHAMVPVWGSRELNDACVGVKGLSSTFVWCGGLNGIGPQKGVALLLGSVALLE